MDCNIQCKWKSLSEELDSDLLDLAASLEQGGAEGENRRVVALRLGSKLHCHTDTLARVEQARGEGDAFHCNR